MKKKLLYFPTMTILTFYLALLILFQACSSGSQGNLVKKEVIRISAKDQFLRGSNLGEGGSGSKYGAGGPNAGGGVAGGATFMGAPISAVTSSAPMPKILAEGKTFDGRSVFYTSLVMVKRRQITINLWDMGMEDGDIISLYLNGEPIIENYTLTKQKHPVQANLSGDNNELYMYAHNLGSVPPNTAALEMVDGSSNQLVVLSGSLQISQGIHLKVD